MSDLDMSAAASDEPVVGEPAPRARMRNVREYAKGEEIANSVIHGLGIALAIAGLVILVAYAVLERDGYKLAGAIVFGVTLVFEYTASTLYHAIAHERGKHVMKILDHCGIYLLIAGTYVPFTIVTLRGDIGWLMFGIITGLAVVGLGVEAFWAYRPRWLSASVYLGMGWLVMFSIKPLVANLDPAGLWLLVAGGLSYTVGTIFYVLKKIPYMHAVWHVWVLAGSTCHFFAVLLAVIIRG